MNKSAGIFISREQIKQEFYRSTERFHVIACWVGILLNLIWFVSDYFVLHEHWISFMEWRVTVSTGTIILLLFRKKIPVSIYVCMFFLVLGIAVQNAYMWSVMDADHMKQHTFAYMALFVGAGMLVLWEFYFSVILMSLTLISNFVFFSLFQDKMMFAEFMIDGGLLTFSVGIFCMFMIRSRYRLTMTEIKSRLELAKSKEIIEKEHTVVSEQKLQIESHKNLLEEVNKEITDSINYAKRIQAALIPTQKEFDQHFRQNFILFQPKDIVSGDFYWIKELGGKIYYATADCTGHGVPGGFMTMLGLSFLDEIVKVDGIIEPGQILDTLKERIVVTLKQTGEAGENKDGMDIALCCVDLSARQLTYAAANNSIYTFDPIEHLAEHKPDKQPCGFFHASMPFSSNTISLTNGMMVYSLTDGYPDQFGGPKGKKFKYRQLEELLIQNANASVELQKKMLSDTLRQWMQNKYPQVDDILLIGIKIVF